MSNAKQMPVKNYFDKFQYRAKKNIGAMNARPIELQTKENSN